MFKCSSDLDCLQDIDDRVSRIGQAVTHINDIKISESSVLSINYLLILILIILICFLILFFYYMRFLRSRNLEHVPLVTVN